MQSLTPEEKAKVMALPLIELDENNHNDTDSILKGIKDVFAAMDLPLMDELVDGDKWRLVFSRKDGELVSMVRATYDSEFRLIMLAIKYSEVPKRKRNKIAELINLMNFNFPQAGIAMIPGLGVVVKSDMFLTRWFNTQELFWNLKSLLFNGSSYLAIGEAVLNSNETPTSILDRLGKGIQEIREGKRPLPR